MILISIKSEVVDDKRQFKTDRAAMIFLRKIDRLHMSHRIKRMGKKPRKKIERAHWMNAMAWSIPLCIEIINTKYNQLNLNI